MDNLDVSEYIDNLKRLANIYGQSNIIRGVIYHDFAEPGEVMHKQLSDSIVNLTLHYKVLYDHIVLKHGENPKALRCSLKRVSKYKRKIDEIERGVGCNTKLAKELSDLAPDLKKILKTL